MKLDIHSHQLYVNCTSIARQLHGNYTSIPRQLYVNCSLMARQSYVNCASILRQLRINRHPSGIIPDYHPINLNLQPFASSVSTFHKVKCASFTINDHGYVAELLLMRFVSHIAGLILAGSCWFLLVLHSVIGLYDSCSRLSCLPYQVFTKGRLFRDASKNEWEMMMITFRNLRNTESTSALRLFCSVLFLFWE